jgi:HSP20 family protein
MQSNIEKRNESNGKVERVEQAPAHSIAPYVDIFEGADETWVVADLPGVKKDDLHIELEHDELRLRAQGKSLDDGDVHWARAFRLPPNIDATKVAADLKDGVLTLKLPKPAELKPRKIDVKVA